MPNTPPQDLTEQIAEAIADAPLKIMTPLTQEHYIKKAKRVLNVIEGATVHA